MNEKKNFMLRHVICVILFIFSFFLQDFYMACKNTTSVIFFTLALCKYIAKIIYTIIYLHAPPCIFTVTQSVSPKPYTRTTLVVT